MSTHCITFRIADKTVGGKTYEHRRSSLMENANEGTGFWTETTSFVLSSTQKTTEAFARKIVKDLSRNDDLVVVFDPDDQSASYFGPLEHFGVLQSFFPKLKKLP